MRSLMPVILALVIGILLFVILLKVVIGLIALDPLAKAAAASFKLG